MIHNGVHFQKKIFGNFLNKLTLGINYNKIKYEKNYKFK